jgi:glycogen debranching enzyme
VHGPLVQALARIAFARAADRVRQEADEVLAAVSDADELPSRLADIAGWMPLPTALVEPRTLVAETLLERGGLPTADLQPA